MIKTDPEPENKIDQVKLFKLIFTANWEDPNSDYKALKIKPGDKMSPRDRQTPAKPAMIVSISATLMLISKIACIPTSLHGHALFRFLPQRNRLIISP